MAPPKKTFVHPFHDPDVAPVVTSSLYLQRGMQEWLGPEIVSPHYENFAMSRKWAIGFWASMISLTIVLDTPDFHLLASNLFIPVAFWIITMYFFLEGRKSLMKPLLFTFHEDIISHEYKLMDSYWNDNMREFLNERISKAREQIEYYDIHEDYYKVKSESINRFLAIEQVNLKNHITQRAEKLLQSAEQMESSNQRSLINNIVNEAISEVDKTLNESIDDIQDGMFESALIGIKRQSMTYEKDPLLPLIKSKIEGKIKKLTSMTEEEKIKLIQLSKDQIESLKSLDRKMKDEFLQQQPKLDNSIKAYPQVQKALNNWGRTGGAN